MAFAQQNVSRITTVDQSYADQFTAACRRHDRDWQAGAAQ
jgi:hypothetical protein